MVREVLDRLKPVKDGIYVDATFGMGGHTLALIKECPDIHHVIAIDWDEDSLNRSKEFIQTHFQKINFYIGNFIDLPVFLEKEGIDKVDGIIMDLGISSYHFEQSGRGFSFKKDEPLDMRINANGKNKAYDLINFLNEDKLGEIIRLYGEETWAKKIAKVIVEKRREKKIETAKELADLIFKIIPRKFHPQNIHPATKTFQALRIAVNSELDNLNSALEIYPDYIKDNGRICVISFHSLEDRIVKDRFRSDERLQIITKKPLVAEKDEIMRNPRARSAKLRVAEKKGGNLSHDL
jgi:16S rRNA (cytosine1402-N4)-methyltransferase